MKRRTISLMLAAALALAMGAASMAADPGEETSAAPEETISQDIPREAPQETETSAAPETAPEPAPEPQPAAPAAPGVIAYDTLEEQVLGGSLNALVLGESIKRIEANDYDRMQEDLRDGINEIVDLKWQLDVGGGGIVTGIPALDAALSGMMDASTASTKQTLQTQYEAMRDTLADLKEGKIQKEAADGIRQLEDARASIVMVAQSMYIQLSELNATRAGLDRSLDALDRQLKELELRYDMGQISALTLQQVKAGRTSLVSGMQTMDMSLKTLNMNLEALVGAELTGESALSALPAVTDEQLAAMDLETDLAAAKAASFTLYSAQKTLDDARETFEQADEDYKDSDYQFVQAQHAWQAAQYTYEAAVQSFELSFRTQYAQVKDYKQVLEAAKTALALEESSYAADRLKYEQGTISKNTLLAAADDLETARDKVATAQRNLLSAYNTYRWAVDRGILN